MEQDKIRGRAVSSFCIKIKKNAIPEELLTFLGIYKNRESWFRNGISKLPRLSGLISLTIQLLQLLMNQKIYTSSSPFLNKPIFAFFCMIGIRI